MKEVQWRRPWKKNPIEFYECQNLLLENWKESPQKLEKLLAEKGIKISHMTIWAWKKKMNLEFSKLIGRDEGYIRRLAEMELDTIDNLVEIQREIKDMIVQLKNEIKIGEHDEDKLKAYHLLIGLFNTSLNKISIAMKAKGELVHKVESTKQISINVNQNIQEQILKWMEDRNFIEKDGWITIYAPELIDIFKKRKKKVKA